LLINCYLCLVQKKNNNRANRKRRGGRRSFPRSMPTHTVDSTLSSYTPSISFTKKFRFVPKASGQNTNVTVYDILDLMSMINVGGITGYRICSAVRIRALKLIVQPTFSTTPNLVSNPVVLQVYTSTATTFGGPAKIYSCENIGSSPGKTTIPLSRSLASQWFNPLNNQQSLFNVNWVNTSFYLDITIEFGIQNTYDNVQAASATAQTVSGTAGQVVILPLDGNGPGYLTPVFYATA